MCFYRNYFFKSSKNTLCWYLIRYYLCINKTKGYENIDNNFFHQLLFGVLLGCGKFVHRDAVI